MNKLEKDRKYILYERIGCAVAGGLAGAAVGGSLWYWADAPFLPVAGIGALVGMAGGFFGGDKAVRWLWDIDGWL